MLSGLLVQCHSDVDEDFFFFVPYFYHCTPGYRTQVHSIQKDHGMESFNDIYEGEKLQQQQNSTLKFN